MTYSRNYPGFFSWLMSLSMMMLGLTSCTCSKQPETSQSSTTTTTTSTTAEVAKNAGTTGGPMMHIQTQYGTIDIQLYPNEAPKTVARVTELAKKGFYDGLTFHRVVPGFVVQGGDPKGDGTGGSGQNLPAEFNNHEHVEGAVAMARAADPNSADSQFYISLGRHPHLDHNYTVFGQVVKGMDAVQKIKQGDKMTKVTAD